jgi:hypothetical protein
VAGEILVASDDSYSAGGGVTWVCYGANQINRSFVLVAGPNSNYYTSGNGRAGLATNDTEDDTEVSFEGVLTHELLHATGAFFNGPDGGHWTTGNADNCSSGTAVGNFLTMCDNWFGSVNSHERSWKAQSMEHQDIAELNEAY